MYVLLVLCLDLYLSLVVLHPPPSVVVTQLCVCWYNVPGLSQTAFQTASKF